MDTLSSPSLWDKLRATILTARAKSTDPADSGDPASYVRNVALGSLPTGGDVTDMLKLMVAMSGPQGRAQAGMAVGEAAKNVKPRDIANLAVNTATQTALGGAGAVGTYKGAGALLRMMLKEHEVQYIKGMLGVPFTSRTTADKESLKRLAVEIKSSYLSDDSQASAARKLSDMPSHMRGPAIEIARRNPAFREALKRNEVWIHYNTRTPLTQALGKFYTYKDASGNTHVADWYHFYDWIGGPMPNLIPHIIRQALKGRVSTPHLEQLAIQRGAGRHVIDWKLPDVNRPPKDLRLGEP